MQKGSSLIGVIVLIVAIVAVGAWWIWQKNDVGSIQNIQAPLATSTPSDWQTYTSERFEYEFRYPSDTVITINPPVSQASTDEIVDIDLTKYLNIPTDIQTSVQMSSGGLVLPRVVIESRLIVGHPISVREWVQSEIENGRSIPTPLAEKDTTVATQPAYYIEYSQLTHDTSLEAVGYAYYFFHGNVLYQISGIKVPEHLSQALVNHPYYPYLKAAEPVAEQIIQSFRFTK